MMAPAAAARNAPLTPRSASRAGRQAQFLQRPQADLLHADAAGPHQAQGVHVDRLHVCGTAGRPARPAGDQLGGDALGFLLDVGRTVGEHRRLAVQDVLDARAQPRPFRVGDVEVASEVEEGALSDGVSDALCVNEPMGEVGLSVPRCAGSGCAG